MEATTIPGNRSGQTDGTSDKDAIPQPAPMRAQTMVARNLRRLRVAQGLSQEALAIDAEIDRTYMSRLERAMENPTVAVLERLAKALKAPIAELFVPPKKGEPAPQPLKGGRRPRQ